MLYLIVSILNWISVFVFLDTTSVILYGYVYYLSAIFPIVSIIYLMIQSKKKKLNGMVVAGIIVNICYIFVYCLLLVGFNYA